MTKLIDYRSFGDQKAIQCDDVSGNTVIQEVDYQPILYSNIVILCSTKSFL